MGGTTKTGADAARAMDALRRIVHALHAANSRAKGDLRVTAAQLFVIRQIAAEPALSLSALAERTRGAQSSVSEVVTRLVGLGLVRRGVSREDGRRAELTLTAAGRAIAAKGGQTVQERMVEAFERLPVAMQDDLSRSLAMWTAAAGLMDESPAFFFEDAG